MRTTMAMILTLALLAGCLCPAASGDAQPIRPANPAASGVYAPDGTYVEARGDAHVRTLPSLSGKSLGIIADGGRAFYAGDASTDACGVRWYKVYHGGGTGWVSSACVRLTIWSWDELDVDQGDQGNLAACVAVTGDTGVRSDPDPTSKSLGSINKGSTQFFTGGSTTDERGVCWYEIHHKSGTGWVPSTHTRLVRWRWEGHHAIVKEDR